MESEVIFSIPLCDKKRHGKIEIKKKLGQRRETQITWAGPGPRQWERKSCAVVTARTRRQLMYAGHRKAELRRRHSLWDLCVVLTWSQRCFPASVPLHTLIQDCMGHIQPTRLRSIRAVTLVVHKQTGSCKHLLSVYTRIACTPLAKYSFIPVF